jgi:hypothetical protein
VTDIDLRQHFDKFRFAINRDLVRVCKFENALREFAATFRRNARRADPIPR